jgi:hypothetical protein
LNAIENATGVSFNHVPLMPEAMMDSTSRQMKGFDQETTIHEGTRKEHE